MQTRRDFLRRTTLGSAALISGNTLARADTKTTRDGNDLMLLSPDPWNDTSSLDLGPARWIWYPSERTLPSTFVLFRRTVTIDAPPVRAFGWIAADSRYLLSVNGSRVQWGPAPSDPRTLEVDPIDLTALLHQGENAIGATVLYYGHGDGTHPIGKPGFIFRLELQYADGTSKLVTSDESWRTNLPGSWTPGRYKRWYLRALQEQFDARRYPFGWDTTEYSPGADWLPAMALDCPPDKPPVCSTYPDYLLDSRGDRSSSSLLPRSIPLLREIDTAAARLAESFAITWHRPPEEYFDLLVPGAFTAERTDWKADGANTCRIVLDGSRGAALTYEFKEQIVGFPYCTIEAPAGTVVELMVQEAHRPGGPPLLNTHFHSWTRFICREGVNRFETFDFESCRWVQLHIHGTRGTVVVSAVGVRRRLYPWPHTPQASCDDPSIQRLIEASINTLNNSAQETAVDGMGRERQQYSGDGAHQLHALYLAFGEHRLPARFISTFSQGQTPDGYFLDCWPAYDRLARVMERQVGLTEWGPLLDHGVGFVFDCFYNSLYTGDRTPLRKVLPRLQKFVQYLQQLRSRDGLLPVQDIGTPAVWIDHDAYKRNHQHHKQCAFNLYAAAMLEHAFAPLARTLESQQWADAAIRFGQELHDATVRSFWDDTRKIFVINRPWLSQEKELRLCDRSLATAILFDQCPGGEIGPAVRALADVPPEMGLSYPANAGWRLWALAKAGRIDVVLNDLRTRWAAMDSVVLNNTLQESWKAVPDSGDLWSHCAVVPLYVLYMSIAGIQPTAEGFTRCRIRPQPGDLDRLDLTLPSPQGAILFSSKGPKGNRLISISLPRGCEGELVLPEEEKVSLTPLEGKTPPHHRLFKLEPGRPAEMRLAFT